MNIVGTEISTIVFEFAAAAVALGGCVVLICAWRWIRMFLDGRAARRYIDGPEPATDYLGRGTALSDAVLEIVGPDVASSPLSADTAALLAADALEAAAYSQTDRLRYWSYSPLLAGLCGTVVGLMSLLRSDPDTMQQHLAGVLFGTLCGAGATLIASSAVSLLEGRVIATRQLVSTLLFRRILPSIPVKKIAVAIEEQLLEVIDARSRALVEDISRLLTPLAGELSENAKQSATAAVNAASAFTAAVEAVNNAPVLADIIGQLSKASGNAQRASSRLAKDAEVLAHLHEAENDFAKALEASNRDVAAAAAEVLRSVEAIHAALIGNPPSLTASVQAIDRESRELSTGVSAVAKQVQNLNQEFVGLTKELSEFGSAKVEALGRHLDDRVRQLVEVVREQLEGAPGRTSDALQRVGNNATTLASQIQAATDSLEELEKRSTALVAFVNSRIQSVVTSPMPTPTDVGFTSRPHQDDSARALEHSATLLAECAHTLRDISNAVRASERPNPRPGVLRRAWRRITT